jgi:hypothetical protein
MIVREFYKKLLKTPKGIEITYDKWRTVEALRFIEESEIFDLGDATSLIELMDPIITETSTAALKFNMPYDKITVGASNIEPGTNPILMISKHDEVLHLAGWSLITIKNMAMGTPMEETIPKGLEDVLVSSPMSISLTVKYYNDYDVKTEYSVYLDEEDHRDLPREVVEMGAAEIIRLFASFIYFLDTKNITAKTIRPDQKLVKSCLKKGKQPPFTYKILEVERPKTKSNAESATGTGTKQRLHLCRGHFREYTDEKPLFGKVTGRFWIPSHARGDEKLGTISKDYKIKV